VTSRAHREQSGGARRLLGKTDISAALEPTGICPADPVVLRASLLSFPACRSEDVLGGHCRLSTQELHPGRSRSTTESHTRGIRGSKRVPGLPGKGLSS